MPIRTKDTHTFLTLLIAALLALAPVSAKPASNTVINETTGFAQNFVGDIKGAEGSPVGVLGHGVVGCLSSDLSGGNCGQGAVSAAAGEIATGWADDAYGGDSDKVKELIRDKVNPTLAALTSGGDLGQFSINQGVNDSQLKNNYLTHADQQALLDELAACEQKNNGYCDNASTIIEKYKLISLARDKELSIQCGPDRACAIDKLNDIATDGWDYVVANYTKEWEALQPSISGGDTVTSYLNDLQAGSNNFDDGFIRQVCGGVYDQRCMKLERDAQTKQGLVTLGGLTVVAGAVLLPEIAAAARACVANPLCWSEMSALAGEGALGFSGATAGQTFFTVGAAGTAVSGQLVMQHGDEIIGVIDNLGNVLRPASQGLNETGPLLLQNAKGATGYIDDTGKFVVATKGGRDTVEVFEPGANISPNSTLDRYPAIGRDGTFITEVSSIERITGSIPAGVKEIRITRQQADQLETDLGLNPGSLESKNTLSIVSDVQGRCPRCPVSGNDHFLGGGQGLPGGGSELVIDSIPSTGGNGIRQIMVIVE